MSPLILKMQSIYRQLLLYHHTIAGIGQVPCDAHIFTLNSKITHNFDRECAIFASMIMYLVNHGNRL